MTYSDVLGLVAGVLEYADAHPGPVAEGLVDVTAHSANMDRVPELSQFNLPRPALVMAHMLYSARTYNDHRVYEVVRNHVQGMEADWLLADAVKAIWPHLSPVYVARMAMFGDKRECYELVAPAELPAPHNLNRGCSQGPHFDALTKRCVRRARFRSFLRPGTPVDENAARAAAWREFQDEFRSGATHPCELHQRVDRTGWEYAVDVAVRLWRDVPDWNVETVRRAFRAAVGGGEPLSDRDRLAWSFLADPIHWPKGAAQLSDGQHRLCAAAQLGIPELLVRTR